MDECNSTFYRIAVFLAGSLLVVLFSCGVLAQDLLTYHIGPKQGFPNSAVWAFLKDSQGFMWYGTSDGLYRYDGYTHQVFTYNEDDSTTLSDNFIFSLFEDSNRSIWIGTLHGGVSLYDPITNSFQRCFGSDSVMRGSQVNDIAEDHAGNIWIASSRGLHRFDGTKLSHIYLSRKAAINGYRSHIRSLHIDALGIIWLGGYASSLGKYDPETNQFEHFQDLFIEKSYIRKIAEDDAGNLWMASFQGGLIRLNKKSRSFNRWTSMDIGNKPGIVVGSIAMSDDRIFMATSIGLCV